MAATIQTIVKPTRARGLDTSGNNNHAQIYSGRALEFDGVTDYLSVTGAAAGKTFIDYSAETTAANRAWTVAVWLNYDAAGSSNQMITGYDNSVDVTTSNYLRLSNTETLGFYDIGGNASRTGDTVLKPKTWYRAVFVYNGSDTVNFYLNGVADGSGTLTSSDANNNADLNISLIGGALTSSVFGNAFAGKMSDFQAWQGAWTQDDVTYDYLNPEQLVLNRGGTSLTNSNLKLWYPMNEGHRGNQSYVLDASNTGIGDDIVNWSSTFNDSGTSTDDFGSWTTNANDSTTFCTFDHDNKTIRLRSTDGTHVQAKYTPNIMQEGVIYKFEYTISELTSGSVRVRPDYNTDYTNHTEAGTYSYLTTPASSGDLEFRIERGLTSGANDFTVSDVKIYPINNKNNATTVFYGDEQITDAKNRTGFASHDWADHNVTGTTASVSGGKLVVVTDDGSTQQEGVKLAINLVDGASSAHAIVASRTYQIQADIQVTAGSTDNQMQFGLGGNSCTPFSITGSEVTYTKTVITSNNTGDVQIKLSSTSAKDTTTFTVNNVTIKEIGVASGWTDADQQLNIPQTALQSYSQIPYNFTKGGSSSTSHFYTCDASVGTVVNNSFTLSMWLFSHDEDSGTQFLFAVNDRDAGYNTEEGFAVKWLTNGNLQLSYQINSGGDVHSTTGQIFDSNDLGKWFHFAISHNYSNDTTSIYKNGQLITTKDHSTTMDLNIGGGTTQVDVHWGDASAFKGSNLKGAMNEMSVWNTNLSASQIDEIYNNGIPLDCTTHSASSNLTNYWRNNGLAVWSDLAGSNNLTPTNFTETMLITAGVDSSRDSQGFFMNKQRTTNSLNFPTVLGENSNKEYAVIPTGSGTTPGDNLHFVGRPFSFTCWVKTHYVTGAAQIIFDRGDGTDGYLLKVSGTGIPVFTTEEDNTEISATASGGNGGLTSGVMTNGIWYFIAGTHEGIASSADQKLYVGTSNITPALITTQANGVGMETSAANLYIGRRFNGGLPYNGEIDDLCFYDNKELTLKEITRNYNAGKRSHK